MRLLTNCMDYGRIVKPVSGFDLVDLGIKPNFLFDYFRKESLSELLKFCEKNPTFHIATEVIGKCVFNRIVEHARYYILCEGDPDPEIIYVNIDNIMDKKDLDLVEFLAHEYPAVADYLRFRKERESFK